MSQIIAVNGQPALFLDQAVNWKQGVSRTLEYKTDIFTSDSQQEQRRALRSTARQNYSLDFLKTENTFRRFMTTMAGWQRKLFLLPDPTRLLRTLSPMPPSTNRMLLPFRPWWVKIGRMVSLEYRGVSVCKVISDVQGNEIYFPEIDGLNWPVGTKVRPLWQARLLNGASLRAYTSHTAAGTLDFYLEAAAEKDMPQGEPTDLFDGLEVLQKRPNWISPLEVTYDSPLAIMDNDRGLRFVKDTAGVSTRVQRMTFLDRDDDETDDSEAFFHRMKGRRGSFYTPSWEKDFQLVQDVRAGEDLLVVNQVELSQMLATDPAHRCLVLLTRDGRWFYNRITNIEYLRGGYGLDWGFSYGASLPDLLGNEERTTTISVRDPWPVDLQRDEIVMASWLFAARLASDSLTLEYPRLGVSQFQMSFQQIKDLGPEARVYSGWGFNYGNDYGAPL